MLKATLVATLLDEPSSREEELAALPNTVEWLEVRADLNCDLDIEWLRRRFRGGLIYTLRSHAEGRSAGDDPSDRTGRLLAAANHYDLINFEGDRDLSPQLLTRIPSERRMISWHGPAIGPRWHARRVPARGEARWTQRETSQRQGSVIRIASEKYGNRKILSRR